MVYYVRVSWHVVIKSNKSNFINMIEQFQTPHEHPAEKMGLTEYVIERLADNGIEVQKHDPSSGISFTIDTNNVYLGTKQSDGTIFSSTMSSIPWTKDDRFVCTTDSEGITKITVTNDRDNSSKEYVFSMNPWDDPKTPEYARKGLK